MTVEDEAGTGAGADQDEPSPVRLLVVEDSATLAEALLFAFGFEPGIEPIGVAPSISRAIEMVAAERPDVVLLDVRLPDGSGLDAIAGLVALRPDMPVIIMTAHADHLLALDAARAGAAGFLLKEVRIAKLVTGVRTAVAGGVAVEPAVLASVLSAAADGAAPPAAAGAPLELPPTERAVLALLAEGLDRPGIAGKLGLEDDEVARLADSLRDRLGARSHLEAVVRAAGSGLLPGPPPNVSL